MKVLEHSSIVLCSYLFARIDKSLVVNLYEESLVV